jgi:FkbM family methyltransferase
MKGLEYINSKIKIIFNFLSIRILVLFLLQRTLCFKDTLAFIKDHFGIARDSVYTYKLKNGIFVNARNSSTDKGEMLAIMSGHEYGYLIKLLKELKLQSVDIIDAGANIGLFTLYMSKTFNVKQSIMIEPDNSNYQLLIRNLRQNNLTDSCIPLQAALYPTDGTIPFNLNLPDDEKKVDIKNGNSIVTAISLSTLFKNCTGEKEIDILKMDIEGGEWPLLNDANKKFFSAVKVIVLEYHLRTNDTSLTFHDMVNYFKEIGFTVIKIEIKNEGLGLIYLVKSNLVVTMNILLRRIG